MVPTLQNLCYQKLADTMNNAPPLLQEMIIGETRERMKETLLSEIKTEMRRELLKELHLNTMDTIPLLVPEVMNDIIKSMTTNNRLRNDFHNVYPHICPFMVECAVVTAEHVVRNLDDSYVHSHFRNNIDHGDDYSLGDYDSDSFFQSSDEGNSDEDSL